MVVNFWTGSGWSASGFLTDAVLTWDVLDETGSVSNQ